MPPIDDDADDLGSGDPEEAVIEDVPPPLSGGDGTQMTTDEPTNEPRDEEPVVDGPTPLTREDFARDSGADPYTVDGPPIQLRGTVAGNRDVVSEGTDG